MPELREQQKERHVGTDSLRSSQRTAGVKHGSSRAGGDRVRLAGVDGVVSEEGQGTGRWAHYLTSL